MLKKNGFYPQLGTNRRWISIALDETHTDQEVMDYIDESYQYVCGNRAANEWIVPANPNYYDVCEEFDHNDLVLWKQSTNIRTGDIVCLYVTSPVSAILYWTGCLKQGFHMNAKTKI